MGGNGTRPVAATVSERNAPARSQGGSRLPFFLSFAFTRRSGRALPCPRCSDNFSRTSLVGGPSVPSWITSWYSSRSLSMRRYTRLSFPVAACLEISSVVITRACFFPLPGEPSDIRQPTRLPLVAFRVTRVAAAQIVLRVEPQLGHRSIPAGKAVLQSVQCAEVSGATICEVCPRPMSGAGAACHHAGDGQQD